MLGASATVCEVKSVLNNLAVLADEISESGFEIFQVVEIRGVCVVPLTYFVRHLAVDEHGVGFAVGANSHQFEAPLCFLRGSFSAE